MKTTLATILIGLALCMSVGCDSKPSNLDAERLLPADVQKAYEADSTYYFGARAEEYASCLAEAHNDISAKYCQDEEDRRIKYAALASDVDFFMDYTYKAKLRELWKQHPKSRAKQADLAKKEADMQKVLLDYDRGRCAMDDHEYHPLTVSGCDTNCCAKLPTK